MPNLYSAGFLEFWNTYPRRCKKIRAQQAYAKAIAMGVEHESIIAGARKFTLANACTEERFIAHPTTWLNDGRWDDEYGPRRCGPQAKAAYGDSLKDAARAAADFLQREESRAAEVDLFA